MGWRAIRLGLDRPALLRTQTRALLKAAAGRELRLMFPMVTEVGEFERAKAIVEREQRHLAAARPRAGREGGARRDDRGAVAALAARRAVRAWSTSSRSAPTT